MNINSQNGYTSNQRMMRPEVLTDKQILKRLNKDFTKSMVFNTVKQISKLPTFIKREKKEEVVHNKKKKIAGIENNKHKDKKFQIKKLQDQEQDSESSDEQDP